MSYSIIRVHNGDNELNEIIKTGLTLEQAGDHCNDENNAGSDTIDILINEAQFPEPDKDKGFFPTARLSRQDLTKVLDEKLHPLIKDIPDIAMQRIADKMGDFFLDNGYWEVLENSVDEYIKENICPK